MTKLQERLRISDERLVDWNDALERRSHFGPHACITVMCYELKELLDNRKALDAASERAFIAGQEEMRERAAHIINSNVVALSRMAETAKKSRLHDEQDLMETQCVFAQELESFIRSLPINPLPNEKEG